MKVRTYGCRGSVSVSHIGGSRYGGNTSCMSVSSGGVHIIVDAGSGLVLLDHELNMRDANSLAKPKYNILLSHLHLDHIIGFGTFTPAWEEGSDINIFTCSRDHRPLKEQVFGAFSPPYWPSSLADTTGAVCTPIEGGVPFNIEHFTITPFWAEHPDKTLSFHITDGEKTFVHLLDSELEDMEQELYDELVNLCRGADLVVFDCAYSEEDYLKFKGWGHSTIKQGIRLARESRPKRMMFSHFAQQYSDDEIDSWARFFKDETCSEFIFGKDGAVIDL